MQSITPRCTHLGLGSCNFARRYFHNRFFFLFLRLLRCFSSAGSLRMTMDSSYGAWSLSMRVSPFRHPRVKAYLQLTAAFRSLSRLSSAPSARASTLRSFCLTALSQHSVAVRSRFSLVSFGSLDVSIYPALIFINDQRGFFLSVFSFQGTLSGTPVSLHAYVPSGALHSLCQLSLMHFLYI